MKTKELIKLLNEIDPTGETECCVGNKDIHFVDKTQSYWDGTLEVLTRDHSKDPYYNIVGGKYVSSGYKVVIRSLSIVDAIFEAVNFGKDFPVDYSDCGSKERAKAFKESDEKTKKASLNIVNNIEKSLFLVWVNEKAQNISNDKETLAENAEIFFEKNINRNNPIPKDINDISGLSYNDRRKLQWDREIKIEFDGFNWVFTKNDFDWKSTKI